MCRIEKRRERLDHQGAMRWNNRQWVILRWMRVKRLRREQARFGWVRK